jgi:NADH dehydrogenase/NADH:ubiquinone oxidoreductase subunit G
MIHLTINDQPVEVRENRTLLEACREYNIDVPTLCYHPALEPYGSCRLCMVEIHSSGRSPRLVAACVYPCEEGLQVITDSEAVQRSRRLTAELLLAGAYHSPEIRALARQLGVREVRYRLPEEDQCVLCGLCVRACNEIVGVSAIGLIHRGMSKKVGTPFEISSSTCIGCGTCVLICPTGRIKLSDISGHRSVHFSSSDYNRLYCQICGDTDRELVTYFVQEDSSLAAQPEDQAG